MSNALFGGLNLQGATNDALDNNGSANMGLLATADVYAEFAKLLGLSAQLDSLAGQSQQPLGSLNDQLNALAAMGNLTGVQHQQQQQQLAPNVQLLPLPAAYPVYSANGKQIPGLLTDGLGNFWQIVPDDETPDDPANMRELVTEDAFAADAVGAASGFSGYPAIGSVSSGSDTAYSPHSPANSSSSYADAIGSPASADIDWDIYKPQQQQQQQQQQAQARRAGSVTSTGTMSPAQGIAKVPSGEIYPSLNLNGFSPAATLVGYTTTPPASSSSGTINLETVQPMALHSHSHSHDHHGHDHYGHSHPISTIAHPSLQNPLASGIRANSPPRDDVSYPCPVQGCPASFRCASRGVVYAPGRMQLLYSDSVPIDNIEASGGEVVSDRDCEFVKHLFAEHELELSSKEPNPKNGRPEKVWRCPLCPYRSKKCNVEAHMLSAGSGHHPAKHLYCATCSTDGRTVWLYNYQSAVNHFEERHGVRVGKRGPGRRKEVIKGEVVRRKKQAGIAWEAKPDGDVVIKTEPGTEAEDVQASYKPILPRPPLPAGFALSKDIKVSEIKTLPDAVDPTNLVSANGPEGWFVDPSLMVLDDGRTVKVGLKQESKADRPKGVARVAGIESFDEAPVFDIETSTFEETKEEPVVVATATVAARATPTPTATATANATSSDVDQLTSALSSINLTSSLSAKPLSDLPTLLPSLAPSDLQALRSQLLQLAGEAEKLEKQRTASVVQLLEMGFGHAEAVEALVKAKGDAEGAIEVLLKGKEGN